MNELDILREALKTHDPARLYQLIEKALDLSKFHLAQKALAEKRMRSLQEQNERQAKMIENLEKTLWKK